MTTRTMQFKRAARQQLLRTVSRFHGRRILVIGDIMLDQYIRGSVGRISPEAPVPIVRVNSESYTPGGAGNVVNNLASLGAHVSVVGVIGKDHAGDQLLQLLKSQNVSTSGLLIDDQRPTTQKCRVIAEHQQVVRYDREANGALTNATNARLIKNVEFEIRQADAVILSDYGKGVITPQLLKTAIGFARQRKVAITIDPKPEHFKLYRRVSCVTPNMAEAWACMHRQPKSSQADIYKLGHDILKTLQSDSVLITRGADGMTLFEKNHQITHIPTVAREVFDVSGAGDTVISTFTLALATGASTRQAAHLSNFAAGLVVGKLGTATINPRELSEVLR